MTGSIYQGKVRTYWLLGGCFVLKSAGSLFNFNIKQIRSDTGYQIIGKYAKEKKMGDGVLCF